MLLSPIVNPLSTPSKLKVLIVSLSNIWTESVRAILASIPHFELLNVAHGGLGAYHLIREEQPALIIVGDTLPYDEMVRLLDLLRNEENRPYCIVMVPTGRYEQHARKAGADVVILRSASSERLIAAVLAARDRLLADQAAKGSSADLA
jgi:DNA-binding NarL/FixJ family response regulator